MYIILILIGVGDSKNKADQRKKVDQKKKEYRGIINVRVVEGTFGELGF